jgi:dolichol-phosphate mannosyltransferase
MNKSVKISVVSPVYGSPELIPELCERLHQSLRSLTEEYEIILVFDCSPDAGWARICEEGSKDPRVKGIHLSRNFGQHYAIIAGLTYAAGEWVAVMDCDLQDVPEEIPNLYKKAQEGFSVVFAQRIERVDSWIKRTHSAMFHAVFDYLTDRKSDPSVANFGIYHQKVIKAVLEFGDSVKCFPLIVSYVGFKTAYLPVAHAARKSGKSSYTLGKALRFAVNLMLAYSNKPLRLFTAGGFTVVAGSLLVGFYYLILHLSGKITVSGFTSLIISVWFIGGMLMLQIGVIGVYLGRVFNQTKNRPVFVVEETINTREKSGE